MSLVKYNNAALQVDIMSLPKFRVDEIVIWK